MALRNVGCFLWPVAGAGFFFKGEGGNYEDARVSPLRTL